MPDHGWSENPSAQLQRALGLHELGNLEQAQAIYEQLLRAGQYQAEALHQLGVIAYQREQFGRAFELINKAIAVNPRNAAFYNNRGLALHAIKELDLAIADFDKAIALKSDYAHAYNNRGNSLKELKKLDAALADYDKAISLKADYTDAHNNRGVLLHELQKLDLAIADFDKAIALKGDFALAYWNRALTLLLGGDLQNGFESHEWRWKALNMVRRDFVQPLWLGEAPLQGKTILLHSEQGLGDTIQFSRYASLVAKSGTQVLLEVQKPLVGILKGLEGVSQAFAQGGPLPAFDYHCPLLSLPLALRTTLKTIPADIPYIKAGQRELEVWSNRLGRKTKPRIGLAWSGSPTYKKDHNRNIEVASLLPHLPNGCEYFALQKDVREHDKAALSQSVVRYFGEELKDGNCRDWPVRSSTPRPARFWSRTGRWTRRPQRGLK